MTKDISLYRPNVGIMLSNQQGQIFIAERINTEITEPNTWQMPQGGIEANEDVETAAFRELHEETNITSDKAEIIAISKEWYFYELPKDLQHKLWGGHYIGQRQKWFLMKFLGTDQDIDIINAPQPEFSQWKWADINEVLKRVIPFKKDLYQSLVSEFNPLL